MTRLTKRTRRKTLIRLAAAAMERDSYSSDPDVSRRADDAFCRLQCMPREELMRWAHREVEWQHLHE